MLTSLALLPLALLSAGTAQAEAPKLIPFGQFEAARSPIGIAVDQSTGDLYTASLAPPVIEKFDASGKPVLPPFEEGAGFYAGAAVDPVDGNVYVLDALDQEIDTYDPSSGTLLSSFPVPASDNFLGAVTVVQIATDSKGDVYVPVVPDNEVLEYSPGGTLLETFTGSGAGALKEPNGVAVDPAGDVWVADSGNNRIEELDSSGAFIGEIKSEGVQHVALDTHGDVFAIVNNGADFCGSVASPCSHLVEYSSTGTQLADVGAGSFETGEGFKLPGMVAVNDSSGSVYVTDASRSVVYIFGPPSAPAVGRELAAEVDTDEAKLGALIKPGGIATSYRFEYGTTTAYGQTTPTPEGSVGEGLEPRAVWASASSLLPGTTYHYRVIATNELGTVVGADQTFTTETAEDAACPNEQIRGGFSAALPDCRAYELVTPPTRISSEADIAGAAGEAAYDGNRIWFRSYVPRPGAAAGGIDYVATRGADGWTSEDSLPLQSYTAIGCSEHSDEVLRYSADISQAVIRDNNDTSADQPGAQGDCNAEGVQVVSGEPLGYENLLLRDNAGTYKLINVPPAGVTPSSARLVGASSDLSHVIFSELAPLTPSAPHGVEDLYEWDEGALRLVTVLPDGTSVSGALAEAPGRLNEGHAVSVDGSHVFFTASGNLYVRLNGERTIQIDEAHGGGQGGGGSFQAATADGSKVLFLDDNKLTSDSTAGPAEPDLYECEIVEVEQAGKRVPTCELTDLTVAAGGEHADVLAVSGLNQDGSYVYFVARGVLASNTREYMDAEGKAVVEGATEGEWNLYVRHGTTTRFVASLESGADHINAMQVSPDGLWIAFTSHNGLTGYDNIDAHGQSVPEVYLYDETSAELACASCKPTGEAPIGRTAEEEGAKLEGAGRKHYLSDGGRLFFQTREALVPTDTNGQFDVYEYEYGEARLISSGTSSSASEFVDGSEAGNDVFFITRQRLLPQDTQEEASLLYDAHVDGGFPITSSPPPCTTIDACRTPVSPQPPIYGAPSSQTFSGAGNLTPPVEVKPKKKARPKQPRAKKTCKRNEHRRAHCASRVRRARVKAKSHKRGK